MTRIILLLWIMAPGGQMDRVELDGFRSIEDCQATLEALVATNPVDDWVPQFVGRCATVPR